jgi:hypothetical protein
MEFQQKLNNVQPKPAGGQSTGANLPNNADTATRDLDLSIILGREDHNEFFGIVCNSLEDVASRLRGYETGATAEHIIGRMHTAFNDSGVASNFAFEVPRTGLFEGSRFSPAYIQVFPKDGTYVLKVGSLTGWDELNDPLTGEKRETTILAQRPSLQGLKAVSSMFSLSKTPSGSTCIDLERAFRKEPFAAEVIPHLRGDVEDSPSYSPVVIQGNYGKYEMRVAFGYAGHGGHQAELRLQDNKVYMSVPDHIPTGGMMIRIRRPDGCAVLEDQQKEMIHIRDRLAENILASHQGTLTCE